MPKSKLEAKFNAGGTEYKITTGGGRGETPRYRVTISRQAPTGEEEVAVMIMKGAQIQPMVQKGNLHIALRDFLQAWIKEHPALS